MAHIEGFTQVQAGDPVEFLVEGEHYVEMHVSRIGPSLIQISDPDGRTVEIGLNPTNAAIGRRAERAERVFAQ